MIGSKDGYALITGASGGIGYELAKLFAEDGKDIVVIARSQDKLEDLKQEVEDKYGTNVKVLVKDLSDPNSPQEIYTELEETMVTVDVLVNNAGFGVYGMFSENDLQQELDMIQVNITSLTHLTKSFLRKMLDNKSGHILNVGSTGSFAPVPLEAAYGASKSFVLSFSEALANELQGTGVSVTCLCPGLTDTGFYERAVGKAPGPNKRRKMMDAATIAKAGYKALEQGEAYVIPGLVYKLIPIGIRIFPRNWIVKVSRWMLEQA